MTYLEHLRTRDDLQRKAIRLFNELSIIHKAAKRCAVHERPPLERRAAEIGAELRVILDKHERAIA